MMNQGINKASDPSISAKSDVTWGYAPIKMSLHSYIGHKFSKTWSGSKLSFIFRNALSLGIYSLGYTLYSTYKFVKKDPYKPNFLEKKEYNLKNREIAPQEKTEEEEGEKITQEEKQEEKKAKPAKIKSKNKNIKFR